uniref:Restriction endonuclease n=1 Tax=Podoviridae sp. ctU7u6 TaxID=2825252 RepID=A0A8S5P917_9CAUD|nr:MAG TPA: restriction endonuclease [Podoviridae sp. ctU7u6]
MEKEKYRCSECKMYKSADEFFHVAHNKHRKEISYMCKECKKRVRKEKVNELSDAESLLETMKIRLNDARNRAKKKNLYFDLTLDNLMNLWTQQKGKCALTGFDMTYRYVCNKYKYSVSLDRINPEKGYTLNNLQLVCHAANMMKGTFSEDELLKFCNAIIKNKNYA